MKDHVRAYELEVAEIGAKNDGIVTDDESLAGGLPGHALRGLHRHGVVLRLGDGVYRLRDHPPTWRSRLRGALALAGPDAAAGRRSGGRLHRVYRYRDCDDVEVVAPRGGHHRLAEGRLIETTWLPPEHVTEVDGFRVTSLARTFFDLCGNPEHGLPVAHPYHERLMRRVYNDALARRGLTFTQEASVLLVLAKRGRPGTQLVRTILETLGPRYVPTQSDTETLFYELVHAYDLPEPEKQVALSDRQGFVGVVDFLWRGARVVVEVDSTWHDGPLDQDEDLDRDERLRRVGFTVRRYRYGQIVLQATAIARELAADLRSTRPNPPQV